MTPHFYSRAFVSLDVLSPACLPVHSLGFSNRKSFVRVRQSLDSVLGADRSIDRVCDVKDLAQNERGPHVHVSHQPSSILEMIFDTMMIRRVKSLPELGSMTMTSHDVG